MAIVWLICYGARTRGWYPWGGDTARADLGLLLVSYQAASFDRFAAHYKNKGSPQ